MTGSWSARWPAAPLPPRPDRKPRPAADLATVANRSAPHCVSLVEGSRSRARRGTADEAEARRRPGRLAGRGVLPSVPNRLPARAGRARRRRGGAGGVPAGLEIPRLASRGCGPGTLALPRAGEHVLLVPPSRGPAAGEAVGRPVRDRRSLDAGSIRAVSGSRGRGIRGGRCDRGRARRSPRAPPRHGRPPVLDGTVGTGDCDCDRASGGRCVRDSTRRAAGSRWIPASAHWWRRSPRRFDDRRRRPREPPGRARDGDPGAGVGHRRSARGVTGNRRARPFPLPEPIGADARGSRGPHRGRRGRRAGLRSALRRPHPCVADDRTDAGARAGGHGCGEGRRTRRAPPVS